MNEICKRRVQRAFRYFCDTMGIDRRSVVFKIASASFLNRNEGVESVYGTNETVACVEMPVGVRKRYYVYISNREGLSGDMLVESVAHELVHVMQHRDGRLSASGNNDADMVYEFDGVKYDSFKTHMDYFTAPWEVEARLKSRKMVVDFNRYMRDNAAHKLIKKLN